MVDRVQRPVATQARGKQGSALLATLIVAAGLSVATAVAVAAAAGYAREVRARHDASCARYAAVAGLQLGPVLLDRVAAENLIGPGVSTVAVSYRARSDAWCMLEASAECRGARRSLGITVPAPCPF